MYYERSTNTYDLHLATSAKLDGCPPGILIVMQQKGLTTLNAKMSERFVTDRVFPPDRQVLGIILKDLGLKFYHPVDVLRAMQDRCTQDDYECIYVGMSE